MQARLWSGVAACFLIAVGSGVAEWRRGRRRNLDRVGVVPWPGVQLAAILGALMLASVALNL